MFSAIIELKKRLSKKNIDLSLIALQCNKISEKCIALIEEHGNRSDVSERLEWIRQISVKIRLYSGGMSMENIIFSPFNRKEALKGVNAMIGWIKEIGKILKIQFKEIES